MRFFYGGHAGAKIRWDSWEEIPRDEGAKGRVREHTSQDTTAAVSTTFLVSTESRTSRGWSGISLASSETGEDEIGGRDR
ncbi:hypothetical protein K438DRAFT_593001 [Mycena galopus ATCC 62051]|nr:hypothetical protein K438DRAFT_593001 [Mycena galopus ATCC 62051]